MFSQDTEAQILLKDAREAPTKIAIQSFVSDAATPSLGGIAIDLETQVTADLIFSRIFKVLPSEAFLESSIKGPLAVFQVDNWKQIGAQYLVRAQVKKSETTTTLEGYVFDIGASKLAFQRNYSTSRKDLSHLAHQFGDDIVELVTGRKGLFSTKIAFTYLPPKSKMKEIWVMDFNGKDPFSIVSNGRTNMSPAWSHDGRFVYYSSSSTIDWHLWRSDLNGKQKQLTTFRGSALGPAAMPNGRELVISLSKDGNQDIYLTDLDGNIKKQLTKKRGINVAPFPSPDGKRICFSSDRLGNLHIFSLNLETLEDSRLTRVGTLNDSCVWSPIDNIVLFSGMDTDREFDIFAMDDHGNNMERLTYDSKTNETPTFSPDGKLIAYSSKRSGRNQIYIAKVDGSQELALDLPGDASQPAWSPRLGY